VLQVGLDGFVLLVELRQVGDDVFDDVGVGEGVDLGFLLGVGWDSAQTSKCVNAINIHRATPADPFSATPSECQGRVDLVLDSNQGIQHHWSRLVQIQCVTLHAGFGRWLIWVPAIDVECLDLGVGLVCGILRGGIAYGGKAAQGN